MIVPQKNFLVRFFSIDTDSGNRNYGLDVMRALGLILVLCGHSFHFFDSYFPKIYRLSHFTINAVELFFALSGFLIGGMFIRGIVEQENGSGKFLWNFLKRRWYKTLPGYFLALVLIYLSGYFITGYHSEFNTTYFFFLQNLHESKSWFFPVSYSLAIEEWFYLVFPLLFLALIFIFRKFTSYKNLLLASALIFIFGSLLYRTYIYFQIHADWDTVMRKSILTRMDSTVYGVLLAIAFQYRKEKIVVKANYLMLIGLLLHALCLYFRIEQPEGYFYNVIYFSAIPISFVFMIPWFYKIKIGNKFLFRFFTTISLFSYAFYLIHLSPIQEILMHYIHEVSLFEMTGWYLFYLFVVSVLAILWYKYFEKPIMDLREK